MQIRKKKEPARRMGMEEAAPVVRVGRFGGTFRSMLPSISSGRMKRCSSSIDTSLTRDVTDTESDDLTADLTRRKRERRTWEGQEIVLIWEEFFLLFSFFE